jgi:hypothetical protein
MAMRASLLLFLSLGLLAWGCGGTSTTAPVKSSGGSAKAGEPTKTDTQEASGPLTFAKGGERACMLHYEADGYFRCLASADGQCFHFGAVCQPPKECMFDRKSKLHKTCTEVREGRCLRFGASCQPADACMYDPKSNQYHHCEAASKGACSRFADVCEPSA